MGPHGMLLSVGAYQFLGALFFVILIGGVYTVLIAVGVIRRRRNIK